MNTYLISDTHFGHENVYKFTKNGSDERIRPWADNATAGDRIIKEKWNAVVKPTDMVYHLGDVAWTKEHLQFVKELNGRKQLVLGNHDHFHASELLTVFEDVLGTFYKKGLILSHFPVHHTSFGERFVGNVHGHTHHHTVPDPRYFNVSVESPHRDIINIGYGEPIPFNTVRRFFQKK